MSFGRNLLVVSLLWLSYTINNNTCLGDNATVTATLNGTEHSSNITTATNSSEAKEVMLQAVYWEVKPFVFINGKGEIDGIIPQIFEQASEFCNARKPFINFTSRVNSRRDFYDLVRSNVSYAQEGSVLKDILQENAIWAPVIAPTNAKEDEFLKRRMLKSFQILKTEEVSVIARRDLISLPNKIFRGILACEQIFVLAILLAVLVGIILWLIERYNNKDFPSSFTRGACTGLYWSIVSMTTVGYGDIQPTTASGRFVTCFWLFVGVFVGCVMTATMTDVVTGSDFSIHNKRISVLENSFEERAATNQYRADVVTAKSYDEVLELVRNKEVFAAMINSDVASWYDDQISDDNADVPLRMVQKLPSNLYVHFLLPMHLGEDLKKIFKCMYFQKDEVYTFSMESFRVHHHPETLYIGSTADLISQNVFVRAILGVLGGVVLLGIIYDVWKYTQLMQDKTSKRDVDVPAQFGLVESGYNKPKTQFF